MPLGPIASWDEADGSPTFKVDITQRLVEITQRGYTNWSDINAMYNYLLAPTLVFGTIFGVAAGAAYPDNALIRMMSADAKPLAGSTITGNDSAGVNLYAMAEWTIKYTNVTAPINQSQTQDPVPMLTTEADVGGEFIVPKGLKLAWGNDGTSVQGDARGGIFIPITEWSFTWPRLIQPPFAAVRALRGQVNQSAMTFDCGTFGPETLLFLGSRVRRDTLSDGTLAWQFSYKFSERTVPAGDASYFGSSVGGWNHYWREDKSGFYRVVPVVGSNPPYIPGNLAALF